MQRFNTAILQEELLVDIIHVLEHGWPVGPRFLYALGALVEAFTIHDTVYFDPLRYTKREDLGGNDPHSIIAASEFAKTLFSDGGLKIFPERVEFERYVAEEHIDYNLSDFLAWHGTSFLSASPKSEAGDYHNLLDLMKINSVFEETDFNLSATRSGNYGAISFSNPIALIAFNLGFNMKDIKIIESYNRRSTSFLNLSNKLEMNLYSTFNSLPHQFGSIKAFNGKGRELYKSITEKVVELDEEPSGSDFSRIKIPPLLSIVLEKSKGDAKAIACEICEIRNSNAKFRKYLTTYEREWSQADTRMVRRKLRKEFSNAWSRINEEIDAPATRIIYQVWDVLKSPTNALQSIGNILAKKGNDLAVINKASGLHDFNNALMNSPVPGRNKELLVKLFQTFQPNEVWTSASTYTQQLNDMITPQLTKP